MMYTPSVLIESEEGAFDVNNLLRMEKNEGGDITFSVPRGEAFESVFIMGSNEVEAFITYLQYLNIQK